MIFWQNIIRLISKRLIRSLYPPYRALTMSPSLSDRRFSHYGRCRQKNHQEHWAYILLGPSQLVHLTGDQHIAERTEVKTRLHKKIQNIIFFKLRKNPNPTNPSNDGFQKNASRPEVPDTPSFTSSALLSDPFVLVRVFNFPIHLRAALVCHVFNFEETVKQKLFWLGRWLSDVICNGGSIFC